MSRKVFLNNRDRFKTSAENRTNKVLSYLRILSHCANKSLYEYNEFDVDKIFKAIDEGVAEAKLKFKNKEKVKFKL